MPSNPIAIIEDDASFRRALQRLLRTSGIESDTFASAEDFLRSTAPESHACLVIDIHLPGMSGLDLIDHLEASGLRPRTIFITAQDEDALRDRASRVPGSVYLCKPFVGALLLEAVHSFLKRGDSALSTSEPSPQKS